MMKVFLIKLSRFKKTGSKLKVYFAGESEKLIQLSKLEVDHVFMTCIQFFWSIVEFAFISSRKRNRGTPNLEVVVG